MCIGRCMGMRTNIEIDDSLMESALGITGLKTKKEVVEVALRGLIQTRKKIDPRTLLGTIKIDETYDYKTLRRQ